MTHKFIATDGILVFVEGDKKEEWFNATEWQKNKFFEVMEFGTMKSMGIPNPHVETPVFIAPNKGHYKFHIYDDWGPVYIENIHTKKKREVRYFQLYKSNTHDNIEYKLSNIVSK
jgi:hypothetical protein